MDIFQNSPHWGGQNFKEPEKAVVVGGGDINLIQQWSVQYQQQMTPVYECGTSAVYYSAKHASGTLQIGRIVGESPTQIIAKLGTLCLPKDLSITALTGNCGGSGAPVNLSLKSTVAMSVGFSGQAQQAYVSEDIQAMFTAMDVT